MAPFYYGPGFNKPNGTGECIVSLKAWDALDAELKAIVAHACAAEAAFALAEMERLNTEALAALTAQHNVQLREFPRDLVAAARRKANDVLAELAGRSERRARCTIPTRRSASAPRRGRAISIKAVLEAREGCVGQGAVARIACWRRPLERGRRRRDLVSPEGRTTVSIWRPAGFCRVRMHER